MLRMPVMTVILLVCEKQSWLCGAITLGRPGLQFTSIVLRFILRHVPRSSCDRS